MKKSILAAIALMVGVNLQAQDTKCGSTEQDVLRQYEDQPEMLEKYLKSKEDFRRYMLAKKNNKLTNARTVQAEDAEVRTIPVVFHVYHEDGDENISYKQIADQMEILNDDFLRLNSDASNTPNAFRYRADINKLDFVSEDVSGYVAQNKYLLFQAAPTITDDIEYNVPTGTKYVVYFKNLGFDEPLTIDTVDGEDIKYIQLDVEDVQNNYYLAEAVANALVDSASADDDMIITNQSDALQESTSLVFTASDLANYSDSTGYIGLTNPRGETMYVALSTEASPPAASVSVPVDLSAAVSNADVAVEVAVVINAMNDFTATAIGSSIVVTGLFGDQDDIFVGDALTSEMTVSVLEQGVVNDASIHIENIELGVANSITVGYSTSQMNMTELDRGWKYASSARIRFELARIDPDGNTTNGVERIYSERTDPAQMEDGVAPEGGMPYVKYRSAAKKISQWDPHKYLNVWTVENLLDEPGSTLLGFAQFPTQLPFQPSTDGVMAIVERIGSIEEGNNALGRTLTHEVGHWLGLRHVWGDEPACDADDGVDDTPQQTDNHGSTCPSFPELAFACVDDGYGTMFMNYMDYSTDACMNLFTYGQSDVMRGAMEQFRSELWSADNLDATGTTPDFDESTLLPYANFSNSYRWVCEGTEIDFEDESFYTDGSTTYSWSFEGGDISSSDDDDPSVMYATAGHYDVALTVTNENGSATKTLKNYIHVSPNEAQISGEVYMDFDYWVSVHGTSAGSFDVVPHDDPTWRWVDLTGTSSDSHKGAVMIGSYQTEERFTHSMFTPVMDLKNIGTLFMNFEIAYANREQRTDDRFMIYYKDACATSGTASKWRRMFYSTNRPSFDNTITEEELSANPDTFIYSNYWTPEEGDWKTFSRKLTGAMDEDQVQFRIDFVGTKGNFLYLDNFYITTEEPSLDVEENEFETSISLFPNPSKGNVTLSFDLSKEDNVKIEVVDILGKSYGVVENSYNAGNNKVELDAVASRLTSGVYFARVYKNGQVFTNKFVISK